MPLSTRLTVASLTPTFFATSASRRVLVTSPGARVTLQAYGRSTQFAYMAFGPWNARLSPILKALRSRGGRPEEDASSPPPDAIGGYEAYTSNSDSWPAGQPVLPVISTRT